MSIPDEVQAVLAQHPDLTPTGLGTDGRPPSADFFRQVAAGVKWLSRTDTARRVVEKRGSYALKHIIERDVGTYISNGAAIAAAAISGFEIVRTGAGPNCRFRKPS